MTESGHNRALVNEYREDQGLQSGICSVSFFVKLEPENPITLKCAKLLHEELCNPPLPAQLIFLLTVFSEKPKKDLMVILSEAARDGYD